MCLCLLIYRIIRIGFLQILQSSSRLNDVFLAVADINFVRNYKYWSLQKSVMFQQIFFEISLRQIFIFQSQRFIKHCFFAEKFFITARQIFHFVNFSFGKWILFNVVKLQFISGKQRFNNFSAGITRGEVVNNVHRIIDFHKETKFRIESGLAFAKAEKTKSL